MRGNAANAVLTSLLSVLVAAGLSCVDATVDSHLRTVAEIEYAADEGGDFWQTPEETARRGRGDCEDMALYLHYLLRGDGIESMVVFGVRDARRDRTGHAWVECEIYGQRYVLDPTCRRMAARKLLPPALYYPVIEQPVLAEKLREYLNRMGDRGVNVIFEAPPESPQAP